MIVLFQRFTDREHPEVYFSKKVSKAQQKYTATEKESWLFFKSMDHFPIFLLVRRFTLMTDHRALTREEGEVSQSSHDRQ